VQVLVMYYSRSGNTKELAQEIAKGVEQVDGVDCVLKPVGEVTKDDFVAADGIIAGSPVYFGVMAAEMKEVFDKFVGIRNKMGDKVGAAFATSGDPSGGKETTIFSIIQAMMIYGIQKMRENWVNAWLTWRKRSEVNCVM
jgi:NAD(P)H dehydrogenase (quinone)